MENNYIIRLEKKEEYRAVENLVRESFWNVYRPGCSEHYVIHVLRDDPAFIKELDFVMEQDGSLGNERRKKQGKDHRKRCKPAAPASSAAAKPLPLILLFFPSGCSLSSPPCFAEYKIGLFAVIE